MRIPLPPLRIPLLNLTLMWLIDRLLGRQTPDAGPGSEAEPFGVPTETELDEPGLLEDYDGREPQVMRAARSAASRLGISQAEFLETDLQAALSSGYPTEACLDVDELADLVLSGRLDGERMRHLEQCDGCVGAVAGAARPPAHVVENLMEVVRAEIKRSRGWQTERENARRVAAGTIEIFGKKAILESDKPLPLAGSISGPQEGE